ncbi:MAG: tetrahydromethanopterin S-methyltransferase subunit D [ANME-2 cluster archaeon]|nr:tetrahydromethanopterin S-methyltransferase subunit D [ANME-2 cluster archaeon]MDF1557390.1 tetrahydromethanopterin S-methyltransferase subunit D [ANME-2 cluster archaeon]
MDPVTAMFLIIAGGVLVGVCVHFIPASAVGAMSASTGIATGPSMLSFGAGLSGILSASFALDSGLAAMLASGAAGSTLMVVLTILGGNLVNAFGTGVPPVSGQTASGQSVLGSSTKDAITGWEQKPFVTPGTDGHGMPVQTAISGVIGGIIGGLGGAMVFFGVQFMFVPVSQEAAGLSGMIAAGIFLINCVLPAYTLVGKTEGMFDRKMLRVPKTFLSCLIVSTFLALIIYSTSTYASMGAT